MMNTNRLTLRPFKLEDARDIFLYLETPSMNCFADMKLESISQAEEEIKNRIQTTEPYFAIVDKESNKVIGEIFAHAEDTSPTSNKNNKIDTYSLCWMLNKDYQGKGFAYEAASSFITYLFDNLEARRLYAYTEDYNTACQHLCTKLGFRHEGTFIEFVAFVTGKDGQPLYENTLQYAILKKEWESKQDKKNGSVAKPKK